MKPQEQKKKRRAIWSQTLILLAGNGFGATLSFLITGILTQLLHLPLFGVYNGILAWVLPLVVLAECGFATLTTRELAQNPQRSRSLLRQVLPYRLLISLLLYACVVVVSALIPDREYSRTALTAGTMVIILPLFNLFAAVLRAYFRVGIIAALNVVMLALQVLLLLVVVWDTAADAMFINVITSLAQVVVASIIVWKITQDDYEPFNFHSRQWLQNAAPFAIAGFLGAIQLRLGLLLLTLEATKVSVALFAAATRFVDLARVPLMAYFDVKFPSISAARHDPTHLKKGVSRLIFWAGAYGTVAGLALITGASFLLLVLGRDYHQATLTLQWLGLTFPLVALRGALNVYCYATGLEGLANRVSFVALVLALLVSLTQPMNATTMAGLLFFMEAFSVIALVAALAFKRYAATKSLYTPAK